MCVCMCKCVCVCVRVCARMCICCVCAFSFHFTELFTFSTLPPSSAKEKRAALQVEPLSQRADVTAAYADAGKRMDAFQQNYRDSVLATKLRESTSAALGKLTEAEDMLKHSRFDESLESFQTSRELAGAVGADDMLKGMPAVESFLKDFGVRAEAFRTQHSTTVRARAQAEARRVISIDLDLAKQHFDHSRNEDALQTLAKARDALSAFEVEWAGSDAAAATFVAESRAAMVSLEGERSRARVCVCVCVCECVCVCVRVCVCVCV